MALCAIALAPVNATAGLFSKSPKGPELLGSHPAANNQSARDTLLRQRQQVITRPQAKPGKTVNSRRPTAAKTVLGKPVKK